MSEAKADYSLSEEEVRKFHKDGIIGPFKVYEPDEIKTLWKETRLDLLDRSHVAYETDNMHLGSFDRHLDVNALSRHICKKAIVDRIASILGPNAICWRTEFFSKTPGDEGTDWHQTTRFQFAGNHPPILWPEDRGQEHCGGALTVWTAFTPATQKNGCLKFIPGTQGKMFYDDSVGMKYYAPDKMNQEEKAGQKSGFLGYDYRELQIDPNWEPDESKAVVAEMNAGECIIFWSTLMHASLPNTSDDARDIRFGYVARYVPPEVKVYSESKTYNAFGGSMSLANHGSIVVCGESKDTHNKIVTQNRRGLSFQSERI